MAYHLPGKYYDNLGHEAVYDPTANALHVTVRGYVAPNGKFVERGGPLNPDDKPLAQFDIPCCTALLPDGGASNPLDLPSPVRDTFHDSLADRRDLLGDPEFRNKPQTPEERRMFAAAYDAAQKIRAKATILGVNHPFFSLNPSLFAVADCFARDVSGAFWLMFATGRLRATSDFKLLASLSAYVLEAEYVPANAQVRLGAWQIETGGATFVEVLNDRIAARDAVIGHLMKTPF